MKYKIDYYQNGKFYKSVHGFDSETDAYYAAEETYQNNDKIENYDICEDDEEDIDN